MLRKKGAKTHSKRIEYNSQDDFANTLRELRGKQQTEKDRHDWRKRQGTYPFQCRDRFDKRRRNRWGENPPVGTYDAPRPIVGENVHTYSNLDGVG